jgi:hypothetical protein
MYMLAPLSEHYDDGFGAIGDDFRNAAQTLRKTNGGDGMHLWTTYPKFICFAMRLSYSLNRES